MSLKNVLKVTVGAAALAATIFGLIERLRAFFLGHSGNQWSATTAPNRMKR